MRGAGAALLALAGALPSEFGWLTAVVTYLRAALGG
jgi:hypothetical protein